MKSLAITVILSILSLGCSAQQIPTKEELVSYFGFKQKSLEGKESPITYYTFEQDNSSKTKMVFYLQGSDPSPQFSYRIQDGKVKQFCWLHGEFKEIPKDYIYVVMEKIGFEELINEDKIPVPEIYQQKNSLDHRVQRADELINHLQSIYAFEKIVVYGHSEGAPVAAKLGTINKDITHLGFWAGNALPDFYDFILESRIRYFKGEISVEEAQKNIDETIEGFVNNISKDTANVQGKGYTNKRWWSYAEPPINHLLEIMIPLYVQVATNDESAPIESTYLIPLEFARKGKQNLTYMVCVGCDHGFNKQKKDGTVERKWKEIFAEFITWVNEN